MKCIKCVHKILKVDRRKEMTYLGEDATEEQMADYFIAELSGYIGDWCLGIVKYKCTKSYI